MGETEKRCLPWEKFGWRMGMKLFFFFPSGNSEYWIRILGCLGLRDEILSRI